MPFLRQRPPAEPSPAVRARLAAVLGIEPRPAFPPDAAGPDGEAADEAVPPPAGVTSFPVDQAPPAPPGTPRLRIDPGARGAVALAGVAVVAVAVTAFVVWRGDPATVALPPPAVVAPSTTPALLVVDVRGDVRRPGLVRLPPGARVADALAAAGGVRRGATTSGLNLARKVVDGEQIVVGARTATAAAAPPGAATSTLLDLNLATADQLDDLPGIGPVLADRIVEWRTTHGGFTSVEQLREVSGIGARKFESLREYVTV